MNRVILCNSTEDQGRFLFWHWELWTVGGGGGVSWFFLNTLIDIGRLNPLWLIFSIQRAIFKNKITEVK